MVLSAPAKVNLYLGVGERRSDGYHDVETVLQAVSLSDTVILEPADQLSVSCEPDLGLPAEENIAHRAALALAAAYDVTPHVRISIEKRIPAGGGLGGASSDAAAVLVGLAALWGFSRPGAAREPDSMLQEVAVSLGADVPFFLGGGTAFFRGRGDVLVRRLPTPHLDLALIKPAEPVPTTAAYNEFDRTAPVAQTGPEEVLRACESGDATAIARVLYNNMTDASVALVPEIGEVLEWTQGERAGGVIGETVAGSGSTVFAVCSSPESARRLADAARSRGWWAEATTSCPYGVRASAVGEG
jgi:4-diphosphocytidyl-2-C-methyl-D-erythritol kinase